jgi:glycosyltransferase involved in cell wall biosynthesis
MRILWIIHGYPPHLNAGAELYTHNLNKYLIRQGHSVCVAVPPEYSGYKYTNSFYEGVHISIADNKEERDVLVEWCDVVMTHLDFTLTVMEYVRSFRPVVWVSHNTFFDMYDYIIYNENASIIYNSNAMKEIGEKKFKNNSIVLHPPSVLDKPFSFAKPDPSKNKYITLINCSQNKGGLILKKLADKMRNYSFLAVKGGYEYQEGDMPPNVKVVPHTKNIQEIYDQSRIVLMPSAYESWGMVASEAMENGIPVIANKTFGLSENLGSAGTYAPLDNIDKWKQCIKLMDKPEIYKIKSEQSLARSKEQREMRKKELKECEQFLLEIIRKFKDKTLEVIYNAPS